MQTPTEGEFIEQEASLEMAVMQLVMGHHISLLVTRDRGNYRGIAPDGRFRGGIPHHERM